MSVCLLPPSRPALAFLHGEIGYLWIDQTINPWTNAPDLILNSQSINHPGVVLATKPTRTKFQFAGGQWRAHGERYCNHVHLHIL
jgi:hypothetical protein